MSEQTLTTGRSSVGEHAGAFQVHAETLTISTQERVQLIDITRPSWPRRCAKLESTMESPW